MMAGGRERKLEYMVVAVVLSVAVTAFLERIGSLQREIEEAAVVSNAATGDDLRDVALSAQIVA